MLEDLQKLLRDVARDAVTQAQVDRGSKWIEQLKQEHPHFHGLLMAVLYKEPEKVLDSLTGLNSSLREYRRNPHVLEFVRQLQARLRGQRSEIGGQKG